MSFFQRFLCLCLAGLGLAGSVTAQEMLEGKPEKARDIGCLTYRDTAGQLLRIREFSYELDSLTGKAVVRERISEFAGETGNLTEPHGSSEDYEACFSRLSELVKAVAAILK